MKHFFTSLLTLAIAAPALLAAQTMPQGAVPRSDRFEFVTTPQDAPQLLSPAADDAVGYTDWQDLGMASWDEYTWSAFTGIFTGENHFNVQMRSQTADPDLIQLKLAGVFGGADFIIDANQRTYECSAARQATNLDCTKFEGHELDRFDAGIIHDGQSSCSVAGGRIFFNIALYHLTASDRYLQKPACIITFDDAPQYSYSISGRHLFGSAETSATLDLTMSGDIDHVKYLLTYDGISMDATKVFKEMTGELKQAKDAITVPLKTGCWALYLYPCNAEGRWLGVQLTEQFIMSYTTHSVHSNLADNYEWIDYGTATVHEGVIRDQVNVPACVPSEFFCNVLTRKDAPGKFLRLVNPYGPQSAVTSELLKEDYWRFSLPDEEFYLDINLENPEQPYLIDRPMGPEYSGFVTNTDGWQPVGSYIYGIHRVLLEGRDPATIPFPVYKWNRFKAGRNYSLEIMLDQHLLLTDNSMDEDMTLTLYPVGNVDYVKYAFATTEDGMEIADKIAASDPSVTVYTASVTESAEPTSRAAGGQVISIKLPADIAEGARLIAVPYTMQGELSGSYLDSEIDLWHTIGNATIEGGLCSNLIKIKSTVETQQLAHTMKFRLVNPSEMTDASKYLYIDATDPQNVNLSADGATADYHTGVILDGFSQTDDVYINTVKNFVTNGTFSVTDYIVPFYADRVVSADHKSMAMVFVDTDGSRNAYFFQGSTITLPEFTYTSAVDTVIPDETIEIDENAPVEYYNLQGVKIANPGPGLYIRLQGSNAEKILIR